MTFIRDLGLSCRCEYHAVSQCHPASPGSSPASQVSRVPQTLIEPASNRNLNHGAAQSEQARVPEHVAIWGTGEPLLGRFRLAGSAISARRCGSRVWFALCASRTWTDCWERAATGRRASQLSSLTTTTRDQVRCWNFCSAPHARANRFSLACPRPGKYPAPGSCSQGRSNEGREAGHRAGRPHVFFFLPSLLFSPTNGDPNHQATCGLKPSHSWQMVLHPIHGQQWEHRTIRRHPN